MLPFFTLLRFQKPGKVSARVWRHLLLSGSEDDVWVGLGRQVPAARAIAAKPGAQIIPPSRPPQLLQLEPTLLSQEKAQLPLPVDFSHDGLFRAVQ